jgi:HPt (histidine-containing phosphotransfer) domain-containing protein
MPYDEILEASAVTYQLDPQCTLPPHLIQHFLRSAPGQLQQLVNVCEARDAEAARAQAHKLKGGLYAAGATRLAEEVEALRVALATSDWPAAHLLLLAIGREFAQLLGQLEQQLGGGEP